MASVTLGRLWLTPVDDETASRGFRLATLESDPQMQGEVRQYGSRLRFVGTSVQSEQLSVAVRCDSRDDIDFIRTYQGQEVVARDPRGRKFFAIYLDPKIPEQQSSTAPVTVTLTLGEVSDTEAV